MLKKAKFKKESTLPLTAFSIVFVFVSILLFLLGMQYQKRIDLENKNDIVSNFARTNVTVAENFGEPKNTCTKHNIDEKSQFLSVYVVGQGETLNSIALNKLGNADRIEEIKALNSSNPYPEAVPPPLVLFPGKIIFLPPEFVKESTGYLTQYNLEVTNITEEGLVYGYSKNLGFVGILPDKNTYYVDQKELSVGDCITALVDIQKYRRVLSISSQ